jgi:hypothetical protein
LRIISKGPQRSGRRAFFQYFSGTHRFNKQSFISQRKKLKDVRPFFSFGCFPDYDQFLGCEPERQKL